jgi:hypothetical protein
MTMNYMPIEDLNILGYDVEVIHHRMIDEDGCPLPKGGVTRVSVISNSGLGRKFYGQADCSINDNYNKKMGVRIALGRALKQIDYDRPDPKKTGYIVSPGGIEYFYGSRGW